MEYKPIYEYTIKTSIKKAHSNLPYLGKEDYGALHFHIFLVEVEITNPNYTEGQFGQNNYEINTVEIQELFQEFLSLIEENLNEDPILGQTS